MDQVPVPVDIQPICENILPQSLWPNERWFPYDVRYWGGDTRGLSGTLERCGVEEHGVQQMGEGGHCYDR